MSSDKPFDKGFKDAIERDPEGFTLAFGAVTPEPGATYAPVEREQVLPALPLDHMIRVTGPSGDCLFHYEAVASYRSGMPRELLRHAVGAGYKYWIPVYPTALVFRPAGCPAHVAERDDASLGWLGLGTKFRTVRMWADPGERILAMNRPALLPLIPFMDTAPSELIEAGRRLQRDGDEGLFTWYCIYVKTVYNEDVADEILRRFVKMVPIEVVLESEYGRKLTARATEIGEQRGLETGERQGVEHGIRAAIVEYLGVRFPEIDVRGVERIAGPGRLRELLRSLYAAGSAAEARAVLDYAARSPH